jgi:NAD(P)-dependent dehydrogenase (short-subunit alcohol dehydrogenase family)
LTGFIKRLALIFRHPLYTEILIQLKMSEYKATILITGGTSGLGAAAALQLAQEQPHRLIVVAGRTPRGLVEEINTLTGRSNATFMSMDLTTKAAARDFAKRFLEADFPPIETFFFNAAIQHIDRVHITDDGIEESFAVNHLNQSLVLLLLKHRLTDDARIVITGSSTHDPALRRISLGAVWTNPEAIARPEKGEGKSPINEGLRRYALSKAANMLFTFALAKRATEQGKNWTVTGLDPGVMPSNLTRHLGPWLQPIWNFTIDSWLGRQFVFDALSTTKVAQSLVRMAYDRSWEGEGVHGVYFGTAGQVLQGSEASREEKNQDELWEWTKNELDATGLFDHL